MSKKSIVSPIARIVLGLILAAVFCIFAAKLVDPWINKIGTAKAKDVIWSIITLIAGAVLLISGIAELVRSLHFNRMVTNSGMQVKKVKHATIGDFFKKIGAWFANAG